MTPMNQATITIGEQVYTYGKLSALVQFHVLRRCGPVLAGIVPVLMGVASEDDRDKRLKMLLENLGPFSEVLAKMSDESANYVIMECMKICGSVHSGASMPCATAQGALMDANMTMPAMIRLTMKVVDQHLADFFDLLRGATAI